MKNLRSSGQIQGKALFDFEDTEEELGGVAQLGRAPALQAGGQEFDPPHLHQKGIGRIAQVVRAHA